MKTALRGSRRIKRSLLVVLAGLVIGVTPSGSLADGLDKYTGYTRPGEPPDVLRDGRVIAVGPEDAEGKKAIGGTVYFRVFELSEDSKGDPWGTGFKDLDKAFKPGVDSTNRRSPGLDRTARYLYVYQVVHDRPVNARIHNVTIRLLVDQSRITSWGHFAEQKGEAVKGISFAVPAEDPKGKSVIRPVGPDVQAVGSGGEARMFNNPAKPFPMSKSPFIIPGILIGNKAVGPEDPILDSAGGRIPEAVVLMKAANFKGAPEPVLPSRPGVATTIGAPPVLAGPFIGPVGYGVPYGLPYTTPYVAPSPFLPAYSMYNPGYMMPAVGVPGVYRPFGTVAPVAYGTDVGVRDGRATEYDADRYVALRADFAEAGFEGALAKGQRSTLFGFTSNDPPTYDDVRVRGSSSDIAAAGPGQVVPANLRADGSVPVPVAFEEPAAAVGAAGVSFPLLSGVGPATGTTGGGGGGGFPGIGAIGSAPGTGSGGGGGTPSSGGGTPSQAQQQSPQQQQNQQQNTPTPTSTPNNQTVSVNVKQNQHQSQHQHQHQHQHQTDNGGPMQVVPEPAAVVTALLGLPAFLMFRRRKKVE